MLYFDTGLQMKQVLHICKKLPGFLQTLWLKLYLSHNVTCACHVFIEHVDSYSIIYIFSI